MKRITVQNLQRKMGVNVGELTNAAEKSLTAVTRIRRPKQTALENLDEISVLLISDRKMAQLHREFLHESGPTDVITFDHGEIFISVETAKKNAQRFRTSLGREIELYIVHGLLHLHGFDDTGAAAARKMERVQARIWGALAL
jgi:probable rRNA maturation factor